MKYRATYAAERLPVTTGTDEVPAARELLVLQLLARGHTDGQIAALLACTPGQVEPLVTSAAEQLGVTTRYEAVASAVQRGLIV
ncbi:MAG TPA: helix-turn-helix transcriptional regulator [Chloroflexota bacterium]|nr:helix-turn-helix transcriptional regulator [Chloroflexota bacterium]